MTKGGKPHAPDGKTWPKEARIPVIPAKGEGFLQRFTEEVREVLGELKEDALAQLRTRLEELKAAEKRLWGPNGQRQKSIREEFTEVRDRLLKELEGHLSEAPMAEVKRELQAPWEEGATAWRGKADRLRGYLPRDKTSSGRVEVVLSWKSWPSSTRKAATAWKRTTGKRSRRRRPSPGGRPATASSWV